MTDSLPKEIVPNEGELKAADVIGKSIGEFRVSNLIIGQVIAKHTRADGLTALQQKERADIAENIQRAEKLILIKEISDHTDTKQALSAAEASLKLVDEIVKGTLDYFTARNLGNTAENIKGALQGWLTSRQSPQPTTTQPANKE